MLFSCVGLLSLMETPTLCFYQIQSSSTRGHSERDKEHRNKPAEVDKVGKVDTHTHTHTQNQ